MNERKQKEAYRSVVDGGGAGLYDIIQEACNGEAAFPATSTAYAKA